MSSAEVRAFFTDKVAAVDVRNGLVVVRRSEAEVDPAYPLGPADLPAGLAFEVRRLNQALGAEGRADAALDRFDRRVVAEVEALKRRLAQRDRDVAELRAAFERALNGAASARPTDRRGTTGRVAFAAPAAPRSELKRRLRRFERSIRWIWKAPLHLLGLSRKR